MDTNTIALSNNNYGQKIITITYTIIDLNSFVPGQLKFDVVIAGNNTCNKKEGVVIEYLMMGMIMIITIPVAVILLIMQMNNFL